MPRKRNPLISVYAPAFGGAPAGAQAYIDIVLGIQSANLLAFWPLNETSGTNADNAEGTAARDGTYTGVSLNSSAGPFGEDNAGLWDGTNDYCDIYSASIASAFNGAEGSMAIWLKVSAAGVWTDSTNDWAYQFRNGGSNFLYISKPSTNSRITLRRGGGGTNSTVDVFTTSTAWLHFVMTWSESNDRVRAYFNGSQSGADQTGLGTWSGAPVTGRTAVGADNIATPTNPWNGYLMYPAIWTTELTAANVTTLYNGGPV